MDITKFLERAREVAGSKISNNNYYMVDPVRESISIRGERLSAMEVNDMLRRERRALQTRGIQHWIARDYVDP